MRYVNRAIAASCTAGLLAFIPVPIAHASGGGGDAETGTGPGSGGGGSSGGEVIGARVQYQTNAPKGEPSTHIEPAQGPSEPPLCWVQPKFSGEEYKKNRENTAPIDPETGETLPGWDDGEEFHEDDDGAWWFRTYAVDQLRSGNIEQPDREACNELLGIEWLPEEEPPPEGTISPHALAGLAYAETKLPAPPVTLRPNANNQVVNLDTHVAFDAPLAPVWVTASFNAHGLDLAATTVATPKSLRVDAGTSEASPKSCTYDLTNGKNGYQLDTSQSDCNITYKKSSGDGTYNLEAQVVWEVTWTDSDNPAGTPQEPALPDGYSTFEQEVEVKEVQSIVR